MEVPNRVDDGEDADMTTGESGHWAILTPKVVGDITGHFYVPAYQRGYRWGKDEVRKLLDDIWESRDRPYYLQPVVVKRLGDDGAG